MTNQEALQAVDGTLQLHLQQQATPDSRPEALPRRYCLKRICSDDVVGTTGVFLFDRTLPCCADQARQCYPANIAAATLSLDKILTL
jgi:hypothetical protein